MKFAITLFSCLLLAQDQQMGVLRKSSENTFQTKDGLPSCASLAVQQGDPSKGASLIMIKAKTGCVIPWHWHTATEQLMIVSGSAKLEMKDGKSGTLGPGGYAMMPGKHVHRFTCESTCTAFLNSSAAFDIHYVDEKGAEIPAETALRSTISKR